MSLPEGYPPRNQELPLGYSEWTWTDNTLGRTDEFWSIVWKGAKGQVLSIQRIRPPTGWHPYIRESARMELERAILAAARGGA
jgi:hypothetical protein